MLNKVKIPAKNGKPDSVIKVGNYNNQIYGTTYRLGQNGQNKRHFQEKKQLRI